MSGKGQIVVGVDGSRFGVEALRWALAEAEHRDCGVLALAVGQGDPDQVAEDQLTGTVRAVRGAQDSPRLTARAVSGGVADTLCAASTDAQLLVLGSHGHGPLVEAMLGSVARYCIHHASCPVVVIPAEIAQPVPVTSASAARAETLGYAFGPLL